MPNLAKPHSLALILCLSLWPFLSTAASYTAQIRQAELINTDTNIRIEAHIDYQLSPTAKEALHKGIPLSWIVLIQVRQVGHLWDSTIYSQEKPYRIQFHALLNQYEVDTPDNKGEMFLTLNAALNFMSGLHDNPPRTVSILQEGQHYYLAIKCQFDRESLPVPLRPFAYLDAQWYLSSDWTLWPIQK